MASLIQLRPVEAKKKAQTPKQSDGIAQVLLFPFYCKPIEEKWISGHPPMGMGTYDPPPIYAK